jgi:biotin operon repressor
MALATAKDGKFLLVLSEKEFRESGMAEGKEFELLKAKDGLLVLAEKQKQPRDELAEKVLLLLRKANLSDRVEGRFEKRLNAKELEKFRELLKQKKIVPFKLSEQYKHAVYKTPKEIEEWEFEEALEDGQAAGQQRPVQQEKPSKPKSLANEPSNSDYSLARNGFMVVVNENEARRLSDAMSQRIKEGEIKGMKSFDGPFYIIESSLYKRLSTQILSTLEKKKNSSCAEIAKELGAGSMAVRVACEFLKEDGSILEKKKEQYSII